MGMIVKFIRKLASFRPGSASVRYFGNLAKAYAASGLPLPSAIEESVLLRANDFLLDPNVSDVNMALAFQIVLPESMAQRNLLRAPRRRQNSVDRSDEASLLDCKYELDCARDPTAGHRAGPRDRAAHRTHDFGCPNQAVDSPNPQLAVQQCQSA